MYACYYNINIHIIVHKMYSKCKYSSLLQYQYTNVDPCYSINTHRYMYTCTCSKGIGRGSTLLRLRMKRFMYKKVARFIEMTITCN